MIAVSEDLVFILISDYTDVHFSIRSGKCLSIKEKRRYITPIVMENLMNSILKVVPGMHMTMSMSVGKVTVIGTS